MSKRAVFFLGFWWLPTATDSPQIPWLFLFLYLSKGNKMADNGEDNKLLAMIVEMIWLASVNETTAEEARFQRRWFLNNVLLLLELRSSFQRDVEHDRFYSLVVCFGGGAPLYLNGNFIHNFLVVMNDWDSESSSYRRRARFESLLRGVLSPVPWNNIHDGGKSNNPSSDITCPHDGAADKNDSVVARFRRGEYDALREMGADQIIRELSSIEALRCLLEEDHYKGHNNNNITSAARDGQTNDFSSPDEQKPEAK